MTIFTINLAIKSEVESSKHKLNADILVKLNILEVDESEVIDVGFEHLALIVYFDGLQLVLDGNVGA
jgi:hypothetical protein